jgi:hypothetical protein
MPIASPLTALEQPAQLAVLLAGDLRAAAQVDVRRCGRRVHGGLAREADQCDRHQRACQRQQEQQPVGVDHCVASAQCRRQRHQRGAGGHAEKAQRGVEREGALARRAFDLARQPGLFDRAERAGRAIGPAAEAGDGGGDDQHRFVA